MSAWVWRNTLFLTCVCHVGTVTVPQMAAQEAAKISVDCSGVAMPLRLHGYTLRDSSVIHLPGTGVIHRYIDSSSTTLTVGVSPVASGSVSTLSLNGYHQLLHARVNRYIDSLRRVTIQEVDGAYKIAYNEVEDTTIEHQVVPGYVFSVAVRQQHMMAVRFLHAYIIQGCMVQIMTTIPVKNVAATTFPLFVRDLVNRLVSQRR